MTQVPLAPPPPTGGPIDGWLFLLWKRLTATGQLLWSSIVPGTSADVAGVVSDETGSPGSLVFSGNPTLQGVTVSGLAYVGDTTAPAGQTQLNLMVSTDTDVGSPFLLRKSCDTIHGPNFTFLKSRGTAASPTVIVTGDTTGTIGFCGFDGANYIPTAQILTYSEGTISTGNIPCTLRILVGVTGGSILEEAFRIDSTKSVTLGGVNTAPALKVTPVASQARWIEVTGATSSGNPTIGTSAGQLAVSSAMDVAGGLRCRSGISTTAGGTLGFSMGTDVVGIHWGSGEPSISAANGSIYLRTDGAAGTTLYMRVAGAWVANA